MVPCTVIHGTMSTDMVPCMRLHSWNNVRSGPVRSGPVRVLVCACGGIVFTPLLPRISGSECPWPGPGHGLERTLSRASRLEPPGPTRANAHTTMDLRALGQRLDMALRSLFAGPQSCAHKAMCRSAKSSSTGAVLPLPLLPAAAPWRVQVREHVAAAHVLHELAPLALALAVLVPRPKTLGLA